MGRFNDDFPNFTRQQFIEHWTRQVATEVHTRRTQLGMTQIELAFASGVNASTIVNIESAAHQKMQLDAFLSVCHGMEVMPAEMIGFVQTRPKISPAEHQLILTARKLFNTN